MRRLPVGTRIDPLPLEIDNHWGTFQEVLLSVNYIKCCDFNDFAKAMADETRQRILSLLQQGR